MKTKTFISICVSFAMILYMFPALPTAAQTDLQTFTTKVDGQNRTYLVYEPTSCKTKSCPVMFMFHGFGSNATEAASSYYDWKSMADANDFIVVYPDSLTLPEKRLKIFWYSILYDIAGKHWDIPNIGLPLEQRYAGSQDVLFFDTMLNELSGNFQILPKNVYAVGHSYGAIFSYYLSMARPDKIAAFGSWAGGYVNYYGFDFPVTARNAKTNPAYEVPGILLSSTGDSITSHQWTLNLQKELNRQAHYNELVVMPRELDHNWDKNYNQQIYNFLLTHSPALPEPEPEPEPTWCSKFLIAIQNNFGIVSKTQNTWNMLFDYGKKQTKYSYLPTQDYQILDVDASWKNPNYFWWALWQTEDGEQGMWRRSATQNPTLDRLITFDKNWELKDLIVARWGVPFVLWQKNDGNAVITRYTRNGKQNAIYNLDSPGANWNATTVMISRGALLQVLWQKNNQFILQNYNRRAKKITLSSTLTMPDGFAIQDFDTGWHKKDHDARILLTDGNGQAKVWKIADNGTIKKQFEFSADPGFVFLDIETTSNNKINLLLENTLTNKIQVWKIHQNNGKILKKKNYNTGNSFTWHNNITTTMFWIGEEASKDNSWISNVNTAWEEPADSVNDYYVALPYNDFTDEGIRKKSVSQIPWYDASADQETYSFMKNRWVEIFSNGKTCYGQIEDTGPYEEDDWNYVFGTAAPRNSIGIKSGIDISPALNDCLELNGLGKTNWRFIEEGAVPAGPWKENIETEQCRWP